MNKTRVILMAYNHRICKDIRLEVKNRAEAERIAPYFRKSDKYSKGTVAICEV